MSLICFASFKGSPGATLTALATAAAWPVRPGRRKLLLEADGDGGVLASRYQLPARPGLISLAAAARRGLTADELWDHAQLLPGGLPVVLGPDGPQQATEVLRVSGRELGRWLASLPGVDVIADVGRWSLDSPAGELAASADCVLVVARPIAGQLLPASQRMTALADQGLRVGWVLVGDRPYSPDQVRQSFGLPVIHVLQDDARGARDLEAGSNPDKLRRSALVRSVTGLAQTLSTWLQSAEPAQPPAPAALPAPAPAPASLSAPAYPPPPAPLPAPAPGQAPVSPVSVPAPVPVSVAVPLIASLPTVDFGPSPAPSAWDVTGPIAMTPRPPTALPPGAEPAPPRVEPAPPRTEPVPPRVEPVPARAEPSPPRAEPLPARVEPVGSTIDQGPEVERSGPPIPPPMSSSSPPAPVWAAPGPDPSSAPPPPLPPPPVRTRPLPGPAPVPAASRPASNAPSLAMLAAQRLARPDGETPPDPAGPGPGSPPIQPEDER